MADNFSAYLKKNRPTLGEVRVNGFVGLATSRTTSSCRVAGVGHSYIKLGNDMEAGGFIADVCNDSIDYCARPGAVHLA